MLFVAAAISGTLWNVVMKLGGPGLILLGLADNSAVPLPGSMDFFTIVLAAQRKDFWWYYALTATLGSLIGGYLTYRIGVKGGEEALEKRLPKKRADKIKRTFEKYGFWSVVVGAISPPPVPIVPFLIVAGAMKYPRSKFLAALALGRGVRYTIIAYLGSIYGHHLINWAAQYYKPILYAVIALGVIGGLVALYYWRRSRRTRPAKADKRKPKAA